VVKCFFLVQYIKCAGEAKMLIRYAIQDDSTALRAVDFATCYVLARFLASNSMGHMALTGIGALVSEQMGARVHDTASTAPGYLATMFGFGTPT
jgi:hypothetical protein